MNTIKLKNKEQKYQLSTIPVFLHEELYMYICI